MYITERLKGEQHMNTNEDKIQLKEDYINKKYLNRNGDGYYLKLMRDTDGYFLRRKL